MAELEWTLRISRKARYARLLIRPFGGLEVVIPPRFPRYQIPGLVQQHADWARKQLAQQSRLREAAQLPDQIELRFDSSVTRVIYSGRPGSTADLFDHQSDDVLVVNAADEHGCLKQIRQWIRQRARKAFPDLISQLSQRSGLKFDRLSIRSQKTRWGSCSSRGNISLNDQLLFAPPDCVEYLIIHELCHTRHMNHSAAFWNLVGEHCADYRKHEKLLGRSRQWAPDWFLCDLYS